MYNHNPMALAATGGSFFAGMNGIWWLLAAFALIAAGSALMRIAPKLRKKNA